MNKKWLWLVFAIVLIACILALNYLVNYKLKQAYLVYYGVSCANQGIGNPFADEQLGHQATLCSNSQGCFDLCGSACPPRQKLSILRTYEFFNRNSCMEDCTPQCVCNYGYEFKENYGCLK